MKLRTYIVGIVLALSSFNSCKTNAPVSNTNNDASIKHIIIDTKTNMLDTGDAYNIDSIKINKDILSLFVNYSGGCQQHSFELYNNGISTRSLPPQTSISLKHLGNKDMCRQLISEEVKVNISSLKDKSKSPLILMFSNGQKVTY